MNAATKKAPKRATLVDRQTRELVENLDSLIHRLLLPRVHREGEVEVTGHEVRALGVIGRHGSINMSDFSNLLGVPMSTATHMADRLVKKCLVSRTRSEEDRRSVQIELSEEGKLREHRFLQNRLAMGNDMLKPLSHGEREIFLELLAKMSRLAKSGE
jgi:DNA-binding MarR family transcriptional regulator